MMILEQGLHDYLLTVRKLTNLVGDRVFGMLRPQGSAIPAVVINRTSTTRQVLYCGTNKLVEADMQLDCYALKGQDVWAVAVAVRAALVDFTGTMGNPDGTFVDQITLTNEFGQVDPEPGIIRVVQLYNVWYLED